MTINITNLETTLNAKIAAATTATPGNDLLLISKSVEALDNAIGLKAADIGTTVQAYDSTILVDADIGSTVQAYDPTIVVDADIGVNVQAYDPTIVVDADIGVNVQAYDADTTKNDVANTFTAEQTVTEFTETVYALTGTVIDPGNGGIQSITLSAPTVYTESLDAGQTVVLMITNGLTNAITFPTITWVTSAGNVAPTLTDSSTVVMWKVGSTLYGAFTGSYV
jgi:hypothetical protein